MTGGGQRFRKVLLLGVFLAAAGGSPAAAGDPPAAVVVEIDDAGVVAVLPLAPTERFGIRFIHSVDHLPVEDWYVLRGDRLVQDSTRLRQYGAGMGHIAGEGVGSADGDWWEVSGMDRPIGTLVLRVGPPSVDHRLLYRDREFRLSACWAGHRLTVRPTDLPATTPTHLPADCDG